ncbi:MAG: glycosyltransferase [Sphingomicrobium sp.]
MTMRIAYLTSQYPATSHTFIRREVVALRRSGVDVQTFSIRSPSTAERDGHNDGGATTFTVLDQPLRAFAAAHIAELFRSPLRYLRTFRLALSHRAPGARGLALGIAHFGESVLLARELQRRGVTHLHNHFANSAAAVGLLATRLTGMPWSFTMHGISETDYPAGLMLARKIEAARAVRCVSWFGRAQGMRLVAPDQWDKMHIVRCGLLFDELPEPMPAEERQPIILCIGRLSPEKGQAGLLRAFASLVRDRPGIELHLVGDGPDRHRLDRLVDELGLAGSVRFRGRLSEADTIAALRTARMLVLPSFMEGLPIVLLEAAALEVPAIASRVAGVPELVEDGVNGVLFTPGNWDELAARTKLLLDDPIGAAQLATASRRKVIDEFDAMKSAHLLRTLFGSPHC